MKVSAQGGTAEPATVIDKTKHDTQRWPWFLPDGKHFVFFATSHTAGDRQAERNLLRVDRQYGDSPDLGHRLGRPIRFRLSALPRHHGTGRPALRSESGNLSGSATPLVNNLRDDVGVWRSIFAVSQNGVMVYQAGSAASAKSRLVWFDRSGKALADFDPGDNTVLDVRLSPDNRELPLQAGNGIWTLDLERKTKNRITFDQQVVQEPTWSPDGKTPVVLRPSGQRWRQCRNSLQSRGWHRDRTDSNHRAKQLSLSRLVTGWKVRNLHLGRW